MLFPRMHGDLVKQIVLMQDAKGTYYAELNANIPLGEYIGKGALSGLSLMAHVGRQEFKNLKILSILLATLKAQVIQTTKLVFKMHSIMV
jgi:hypothetical protein